jgi:large subunit ribosomal protein L6
MARFGKQPVKLPEGVTAKIGDGEIVISGPRGSISRQIHGQIKVSEKEGALWVEKVRETKISAALQGTMRAHIVNMVRGITEGWSKILEIVGAGYRVAVEGEKLVMNIGYSHPVEMKIPSGLNIRIVKNLVTIEGMDKELVGQFAAEVRSKRKPDPYKGAGIKYQDEIIRRKPGKQASGVTTA